MLRSSVVFLLCTYHFMLIMLFFLPPVYTSHLWHIKDPILLTGLIIYLLHCDLIVTAFCCYCTTSVLQLTFLCLAFFSGRSYFSAEIPRYWLIQTVYAFVFLVKGLLLEKYLYMSYYALNYGVSCDNLQR